MGETFRSTLSRDANARTKATLNTCALFVPVQGALMKLFGHFCLVTAFAYVTLGHTVDTIVPCESLVFHDGRM